MRFKTLKDYYKHKALRQDILDLVFCLWERFYRHEIQYRFLKIKRWEHEADRQERNQYEELYVTVKIINMCFMKQCGLSIIDEIHTFEDILRNLQWTNINTSMTFTYDYTTQIINMHVHNSIQEFDINNINDILNKII